MPAIHDLRSEFPALNQSVHGHPLVYLDNASTTQKPRAVLGAIHDAYVTSNANVHRGIHTLSQRATEAYENARSVVARFVHANRDEEIVFTRGTTESINLVAQALGRRQVHEGDEVLVTQMEHHSNLVPWQQLCRERGATLRFIPIDARGELRMNELPNVMNDRTRIVAATHISNSLGTVNPVRELTRAAHEVGALVLIDGAQAAPHHPIDVQSIGCDFYAFSGHKVYGPSGIGVLWGRYAVLDAMEPWQGGGEMILSVNFEETVYNDLPYKFEAGTPNIVGAIGLGAALDWVKSIGLAEIAQHEAHLLRQLIDGLENNTSVRRIGISTGQSAAVSFLVGEMHPHDIGTVLDYEGIAVRSGHHCTQPVMEHFQIDATVRASVAVYNSAEDIARLIAGVDRVNEVLS